jgi:hypothetical protein
MDVAKKNLMEDSAAPYISVVNKLRQLVAEWRSLSEKSTIEEGRTFDRCADELETVLESLP